MEQHCTDLCELVDFVLRLSVCRVMNSREQRRPASFNQQFSVWLPACFVKESEKSRDPDAKQILSMSSRATATFSFFALSSAHGRCD